LDDFRFFFVFLDRGGTNRRSPFHGMVFLRGRERIAFAGLRDLETVAEPRGLGCAQEKRVERLGVLGRGPNVSCSLTTVAEEHRHRLLWMTRHAEDWHARRIPLVSELDDVAVLETALTRELRAHPRGRVPGDFRQRLR